MAGSLEGSCFENCSCDRVCPCTVTSFVSPATYDRRQVVLFLLEKWWSRGAALSRAVAAAAFAGAGAVLVDPALARAMVPM